MKIVADSNVPFLNGVFEPYAEVVYIDGKKISRQDILDADAMIIRTRTRCDRNLLEGTNVKMIATATIGTDHIDLKYCSDNGIEVHNAEGCNAGGVMQYVFSALYGVFQFLCPLVQELHHHDVQKQHLHNQQKHFQALRKYPEQPVLKIQEQMFAALLR